MEADQFLTKTRNLHKYLERPSANISVEMLKLKSILIFMVFGFITIGWIFAVHKLYTGRSEDSFRNETKCGRRFGKTALIFGGNPANQHAWPWLVALIYRHTDKFFCAGSLINRKLVLSGELNVLESRKGKKFRTMRW